MVQPDMIQKIFKSRHTILQIMQENGYDISEYRGCDLAQVNTMRNNKQLDMIIKKEMTHESLEQQGGPSKALIKYHLAKGLRQNNLYEYIEEYFKIENTLTKDDVLIIVIKDEPNDTMQKILSNIWEQEGYYIIVHNIHRLQFNILKHSLVPKHRILNLEESEFIKNKYNITSNEQIPEISRFDPVALAICIRPGKICEIIRPSKTGIYTKFYRICSS